MTGYRENDAFCPGNFSVEFTCKVITVKLHCERWTSLSNVFRELICQFLTFWCIRTFLLMRNVLCCCSIGPGYFLKSKLHATVLHVIMMENNIRVQYSRRTRTSLFIPLLQQPAAMPSVVRYFVHTAVRQSTSQGNSTVVGSSLSNRIVVN